VAAEVEVVAEKERRSEERREGVEAVRWVARERRRVRREERAISVSRWCMSFCHLVTCSDAAMWIFFRSAEAHSCADALAATSDVALCSPRPHGRRHATDTI
jgi:hypothetical protein